MRKDGVNRSWEKVGGKNPPAQVTCYLPVEYTLSLPGAFPSWRPGQLPCPFLRPWHTRTVLGDADPVPAQPQLAIQPPARLVGLPRGFSLGKRFWG